MSFNLERLKQYVCYAYWMAKIESNMIVLAIVVSLGILVASAGSTSSLLGASGNMSKAGQAS